jgi:hypothetical protein
MGREPVTGATETVLPTPHQDPLTAAAIAIPRARCRLASGREAGFLAAKPFLAYRKRGGQKRAPLPDFYIGAHSAVRGYQATGNPHRPRGTRRKRKKPEP